MEMNLFRPTYSLAILLAMSSGSNQTACSLASVAFSNFLRALSVSSFRRGAFGRGIALGSGAFCFSGLGIFFSASFPADI